jgi:hypothetical protein
MDRHASMEKVMATISRRSHHNFRTDQLLDAYEQKLNRLGFAIERLIETDQ